MWEHAHLIIKKRKARMLGLFRQQAVEFQKQGLHGEVLLLPKLSHSLIIGLLFIWTLVVVVWLFNSHYARKETVVGWLEPPEGIIRTYTESSGIVQKVFVSEGERVQQDQPLFLVSDERTLTSGENVNKNILEEYDSQKKLIAEQLVRTIFNFDTKNKDISKRIEMARADLRIIDEQLKILDERYYLAIKHAERYKELNQKNHISSVDVDSAIAQQLSLKNEQQSLLRAQLAQRISIENLLSEQKILPDVNADLQDQLRSKISGISQQATQTNVKNSHIVKATRAGTVNNLQIREGQQVSAGNNIPLLTLFPDNKTLTANLLVPVRSIGFVKQGQPISIRYDAFPYQKFGIYRAKVYQVSKTILLPTELSNVPIQVKEPVYRIIATLEQPGVIAYGEEYSLKPGMTLSADVSLGERTLIQWLLDPIYSLKGRI